MASSRLNLDLLRSGLLTDPHSTVRAGPSLTRRQLLLAAGAAATALRYKEPLALANWNSFTLSGGAHRFAVTVAGEERWVVDPTLFGGRPRLAIERQEELIEVVLTGATYPGTDLPADLYAAIRRVATGWRIRLEPALGRFTADLPFEPWLAGLTVARSPVQLDPVSLPLSRSHGLLLGGRGLAHYFPDGSLRLRGSGIAEVERGQSRLQADEITVEALRSRASSLIKSPSNQRTRLTLPRGKQEWPLNLGLTHPGGSLVAEGSPFDQIQIELDGDRRSGALLAKAGATSSLAFRPAGGLTGSDGQPFRLQLRAAQQALAFGPEGDEEALLAQFDPTPAWLHAEGCSLQVGEGAEPRLFELRGRSNQAAELDCRPNLQAIALPLAGAVVEPTYLDGSTYLRFGPSGLSLESGPLAASQPLDLVPINPPLIPRPIRLPLTFELSILRPDDLLALRFEFLNLRLEAGSTQSPRLVRTDSAKPAHIIVHFPPQHIAERAFREPGETPSDPPVPSRMAGASRLAFLIPPAVESIPYTLESLLDWSRFEQSVAPAALPPASRGPFPILLIPGTQPSIAAPDANQTTIEAPYRLLLSPHAGAGWAHARTLEQATRGGRTELWHTRLGRRLGSGQIDEADLDGRILRAVWSPDYNAANAQPNASPTPFLTSLQAYHRHKIVANTAGPNTQATPLQVERFMLSALGAWIDLQGEWAAKTGLEAWYHKAVMGRDQYVKLVEPGYLFPFGHRASLVTVTERKLETGRSGGKIAYLRQREFIIVRERERTYPRDGTGRQMPFRRVQLVTESTPPLDPPGGADVGGRGRAAFWPRAGGQHLPFRFKAQDWEGRESEFTAPLIFIHGENAQKASEISAVISHYAAADVALRKRPFAGQSVAFAPSQQAGDTALETSAITFGAVQLDKPATGGSLSPGGIRDAIVLLNPSGPLFQPILAEAEIRLPAVEQLRGSAAPITIQYEPGYLTNGFGGPNTGEVWAKLKSYVPLTFPAEAAGGLVTPNLSISGLSRAMGPVGGPVQQFAQGQFDPSQFFSDQARMLGGLLLGQVISPLAFDPRDGAQRVPRLSTRLYYPTAGGKENRLAPPEAVETTFTWSPQVKRDPAGIFVPGGGSVLDLRGKVVTRLGPKPESTTRFSGTLTDFAINLVGDSGASRFVTVRFRRLAFLSGTGLKPSVDVDIQAVEFAGALSFVQSLQRYLRSGSGPAIDVSPEGVTASFTQAIPAIQVGLFALTNLKLSAGFHLPFSGAPARLSFAFSDRHNPFNLTVSAFGGGGFFAIRLGTDGVELLEAALEFGGQVSLNLGVASGSISIMAGIYFKLAGDQATLEGYLRANGSLSVLGLVTITAEFYLGLSYKSPGKAYGQASLTVGIKIAFFKKSVTLTVERQFSGTENDPTFADLIDQPHWDAYCEAFA